MKDEWKWSGCYQLSKLTKSEIMMKIIPLVKMAEKNNKYWCDDDKKKHTMEEFGKNCELIAELCAGVRELSDHYWNYQSKENQNEI